MSTHNICFCGEVRKIFSCYTPLELRSVVVHVVGMFHKVG